MSSPAHHVVCSSSSKREIGNSNSSSFTRYTHVFEAKKGSEQFPLLGR